MKKLFMVLIGSALFCACNSPKPEVVQEAAPEPIEPDYLAHDGISTTDDSNFSSEIDAHGVNDLQVVKNIPNTDPENSSLEKKID